MKTVFKDMEWKAVASANQDWNRVQYCTFSIIHKAAFGIPFLIAVTIGFFGAAITVLIVAERFGFFDVTNISLSLVVFAIVASIGLFALWLLYLFVAWLILLVIYTVPFTMFLHLNAAIIDLSIYVGGRLYVNANNGLTALANVNSKKIERFAMLAAYLLPLGIRVDSFETTFEDLRMDFSNYRKSYPSRGARAFLGAGFLTKVILLFLDCLRLWGREKIVWLIPLIIRMLWRKP